MLSAIAIPLITVAAFPSTAGATVLTFETAPLVASGESMPQDYGDHVTAISMTAANPSYENVYQQGSGFTPNSQVSYSSARAGSVPTYDQGTPGGEWDSGVCALWSPEFRIGEAIGVPGGTGEIMPVGFEYYLTLSSTAAAGVNRSVAIWSFVLDNKADYAVNVDHVIEWRIAVGSPAGPVLASGTETLTGNQDALVEVGMTAAMAGSESLVLVIKRLAGTEDDLALDELDFDETGYQTLAVNSGNLGTLGDGTNHAAASLNQAGPLAAPGSNATEYTGNGGFNGQATVVPWLEEVNTSGAFTAEFWAKPSVADGDDCPLSNRTNSGDRSGWAFFMRPNAWNLRIYNGNGSQVGFAIESNVPGNPSVVGVWNHVVAVYTGTTVKLYVNGIDTNGTVTTNVNPATSASYLPLFAPNKLTIGALNDNSSPVAAVIGEVAWYPSALTGAQIAAHYAAAASTVPGDYSSLVLSDGAALYYRQNTGAESRIPRIERISRASDGSSVSLTLRAQPGGSFATFYSTELTPGNWTSLGSVINSTDLRTELEDTTTAHLPKCFYRVESD